MEETHVHPVAGRMLPGYLLCLFARCSSSHEQKHIGRKKMLMFLRDVEEFSTSLYTASTSRAASRAKKGRNFAEFVVILNTYIKDGSPFEIEIETETKNDILKMADREAFDKLTRASPMMYNSNNSSRTSSSVAGFVVVSFPRFPPSRRCTFNHVSNCSSFEAGTLQYKRLPTRRAKEDRY